MRTSRRSGRATLLLYVLAAGCGIFDNPTPSAISVQVRGADGHLVQAIYSKQFVAGVDETGLTTVQVFEADTVMQTLPIDTVIDIEVEQRLFLQMSPAVDETLTVQARVDVDDRNVLNNTGDILVSDPWRYVYLFNQTITRIVDVVF